MKESEKNKNFTKVVSFGSETYPCFVTKAPSKSNHVLSYAPQQITFQYSLEEKNFTSHTSKPINNMKLILGTVMKSVNGLKKELLKLKE